MRAQLFNKWSTAAGVRQTGPHQIRHMLESSLLDSGYGVPKVAERLGRDPTTLMRYYTRVTRSAHAKPPTTLRHSSRDN